MSTIKSSAENLTLNADGANNDIKFQSNGSEVASIDQGGTLVLSNGVTAGGTISNASGTITCKILDSTTPDISTGENNGIRLVNTGGGGTTWHMTAGQTGQNNSTFVLRNGVSNVDAIKVDTSGNVNIGAGDLFFGTAGKGIVLGATSNVDANTLEDYEEGSFTPSVYGTGTAGSPTYVQRLGKYTKIGNVVSCFIRITTSALGGIAGDVRLGNLPFTSLSTENVFSSATCGYAAGLAITSDTSLSGWVAHDSTYIKVTSWDRTVGTSYLQGSEWTDDGTLMISVVYHT